MIRAVFFDFFETLARPAQSREQIQAEICRQLGYPVTAEALRRPLAQADAAWYREVAPRMASLDRAELRRIFAEQQQRLLRQAGVEVPLDTSLQIGRQVNRRLSALAEEVTLYQDVLPTMVVLKGRGLTLGLLSNLREDASPIVARLGLGDYLDFALSSGAVGADKPLPPIFRAALDRAGVEPTAAVHVGDQYWSDVVGARGVGIEPVLLDRADVQRETDCRRIRSLAELPGLIQKLNRRDGSRH